jgi:hypothetical protein
MKKPVETLGKIKNMSRNNKKLPEDFTADESIRARFMERVPDGTLPCAKAFALAEELGLPESMIGLYADFCGVPLVKCQIGLFGYGPGKKRLVEKLDSLDQRLAETVKAAAKDGVILCADVFRIAGSMNTGKTDVGNACETLSIKVKGCRFGAF